MTKYLLRLDDASEHRNLDNWDRMEQLLDTHQLLPIVGIIPDNHDPSLLQYPRDEGFWDKARYWQLKGWCIGLHGYQHLYCANSGGINPVNRRSEFASLSLAEQEEKIEKGINILQRQGINPQVFFAPAHTFDTNTLDALKMKSEIRIISDTVASDIYYWKGFHFVPQQAGGVRRLPFKVVTFCYHPNTMKPAGFVELEQFVARNREQFVGFSDLILNNRRRTLYDRILSLAYLKMRRFLH